MINSKPLQTVVSDDWISCPRPNPRAKTRLFCFPYAGSGVATFYPWLAHISANVELCFINLPGRETRLREAPYTQLAVLAETLTEALYKFLDKPFAFFGHSMGALICFEVVRQIRRRYTLQPAHIFVSAHRAPQIPDPNPPLHHLSDENFLETLQHRYGPLPAILLQDSELMSLFLPILRADLTLIETYLYQKDAPLSCPISVFGGKHDHIATEESLSAWQAQTCDEFNLTMFAGDHFYLNKSSSLLVQQLNNALS
ncbi:MAG: thioesterase [Anaerolineae bacterium]|nr:thioesterase [Anaerolineae bacterium]